jgi:hypothetical protein
MEVGSGQRYFKAGKSCMIVRSTEKNCICLVIVLILRRCPTGVSV